MNVLVTGACLKVQKHFVVPSNSLEVQSHIRRDHDE